MRRDCDLGVFQNIASPFKIISKKKAAQMSRLLNYISKDFQLLDIEFNSTVDVKQLR